ncbi:hypothetical protein FCV25MIE_16146, partial [Fagus crenata]
VGWEQSVREVIDDDFIRVSCQWGVPYVAGETSTTRMKKPSKAELAKSTGGAVRWVRSFSSVIFEEQSQRKSLCLVLLLFMTTVLSRIKYLVSPISSWSSVNLQRMEPTWSFKTKVTRQRPINWRQPNNGRRRHLSSPLRIALLAKGWGLST